MQWTELHASVLTQAFEKVLGKPESGTMVFARCLTPEVVHTLIGDNSFTPKGWNVWRVVDSNNEQIRAISADRAVEIRETKTTATLLLVDTEKAGAGMDGIYSAAREVDEKNLFGIALQLVGKEITIRLSSQHRKYAEQAIKTARGHGRRFSISPWTEFDFLCRIASETCHPGAYLHLLGLWPVQESEEFEAESELNASRMFVDRLLETATSGLTIAKRIEALRLLPPSEMQLVDLERFLRLTATKPLVLALAELVDKKHLWVNALQLEGDTGSIQTIELSSWRTSTGKIAKWSGLMEGDVFDAPPELILDLEAEDKGDYSRLEVKWKARPTNLKKGAVEYRIVIVTDLDEELASGQVIHSARREEKFQFSNDDFVMLSEDVLISAKVVVSVIGNEEVEQQESEEFIIRFGKSPKREQGGVGRKVRAFSEGIIELDNRKSMSETVDSCNIGLDSKGFVLLRTHQHRKSFRVFRPSLIDEVEMQWKDQSGTIGRWRVKVRASGARAGEAEFVPFGDSQSPLGSLRTFWNRAAAASSKLAESFSKLGGGVGQVYDEKSKAFGVVKEYLLAWAALLEEGDPLLALVNTVEVQSLSGRTIGVIVFAKSSASCGLASSL